MKIDVVVAEIGSTTTLVNGFHKIGEKSPEFIGQGMSPTTVEEGDVMIGIENAIEDLQNNLGAKELTYEHLYATSSAAGGLKMTVHGLVYDMTVRAAKEAALGAGANIHLITSGLLTEEDTEDILAIKPNIILLAGGVDHGERETARKNAKILSRLQLDAPIIYAGNVDNAKYISRLFEEQNQKLYLTDNVYPRIDELNVAPTREIIQQVFEEHITKAPGMENVHTKVKEGIIPTPGAVMRSTQLFAKSYGDSLTIDIGGATTDVHSVTRGNEEVLSMLLQPEPEAKRTVEGDLGLYINRYNIFKLMDKDILSHTMSMNYEELVKLIDHLPPVPRTEEEKCLVGHLSHKALEVAMGRHAGKIRKVYTLNGKTTMAEGKDLTEVKHIIGTGGSLTKLQLSRNFLDSVFQQPWPHQLMPKNVENYFIDHDYIMASIGVLSMFYPESALKLLLKSFRKDENLNELS